MANGNGGPPVMVPPDPREVTDALLRAVKVAAEQGSTAEDTRELGEAAKAALAFAQAIVVLDPSVTASGEPLQHAIDLENARAAGQLALEHTRGENAIEQAKEAAAAPTPRKSVIARRSSDGSTRYDVVSG